MPSDFLNLFAQNGIEFVFFLLKAIIIVVALVMAFSFVVSLILQAAQQRQSQGQGYLQVVNLSEEQDRRTEVLSETILTKKDFKSFKKSQKQNKDEQLTRPRIWILDFKGDLGATAVKNLRQEISAILQMAKKHPLKLDSGIADQVFLRLHSPGGSVTGYGHAAHQLERLREAQIPLTVSIDEVAASGGYMMAVIANQIIASRFAVVGSIGVVVQMPNISRWLKRHEIEFVELTAGQNKRPLSPVTPVTEHGIQHLNDQLSRTHKQFKDLVQAYRPQLDMAKIAEGDVWSAEEAKGLGLVDTICTSETWIEQSASKRESLILILRWRSPKNFRDRLEEAARIVLRSIQNSQVST